MDARRITPAASPTADKVFKIDPASGRYVGYKEFTPNSVVLPPAAFMDRPFGDVLPPTVATTMDRSIWTARREHRASRFDCSVLGQWVQCQTVMHDSLAHVNVTVRKAIGRALSFAAVAGILAA